MQLKYSTVHGSKGLESDFVVLISGEDADNGFPNKKNLLIDAIKIMDHLGGADNKKETFVDYCIGDLHGYKVWYEDKNEPIYTLYYSFVESTTAY